MIPKNILNSLSSARKKHRKIVLVSGVFDILHEEHILFLKKAKSEGDLLLLAIESDERVRLIKGISRPINSQAVRKVNLEHLKIADLVMILPEDFHKLETREKFMSIIKPDILAVSSHSSFKNEKALLVEKYGGELRVVLEHNPEVSTTKIIKKQNKG